MTGTHSQPSTSESVKDYAVISMHEKGFWQIDVYWKLERPLTG